MLKKRIIPCLDVKNGRVVKGINFVDLKDAGDPVEQAKIYSDGGADEICFLDITASSENRDTIYGVIKDTSKKCFVPLTVGGGVRSVEDINKLLNCGADKVSINTAAVQNEEVVIQSSKKFGSQCIVVAIDAKKNGDLCPTKLLPNANFREARESIWICKTVSPTPCGNQWKASPNTRVRGHGCCSCANKCVHSEDARNSLAARYPELLKEWNWSKNDVDPFKILPSVKAMFWWTCNTCEIDFHMNGNNRVNGQNCPDCSPVGFQNTEVGFYYVHKITNAEGDFLYYKAGISNDWKRRLIQLRRGIDETHQIEFVECLRFEIGRDARTLEGRLRKIAISEKWKVKNHDFDGGTELFSKNPITRARELSIL
mgnify:CR=1 FL=1